jgi:hypothetical protein
MNLYLYQPPHSAQPASILYGLIYSTLHQYYWHNLQHSQYEHFSNLFFQPLQTRGHTATSLAPLFSKAATNIENECPVPYIGPLTLKNNPHDPFFLHLYLPVHPSLDPLIPPSRTSSRPPLNQHFKQMTLGWNK